jgi:molybdate transport system substrate-binding protein
MRAAVAMGMRPLVLVLLVLAGSPARSETIHVSAAASLAEVVTNLSARFERTTGHRVKLNFGGSSTLARQIEAGAPADVFLSADDEKMARLERLGRIVASTRRDFLGNRLVIVVADDSRAGISSSRDLLSNRFRRIALAEPSTVPAGIYARQHFEGIGIWSGIAKKVVPSASVRAALAAAAAGNVDAAVVYATDPLSSDRVKVACEIPLNETPRIRYVFAAVRGPKETIARGFLEFLASDASQRTFRRYGFLVK